MNQTTDDGENLPKIKTIQHKDCKLVTELLTDGSIIPIMMPFHEWRNIELDESETPVARDTMNIDVENFTFNEVIVHDVYSYGQEPLEEVNVNVLIPDDDQKTGCVELYLNVSIVNVLPVPWYKFKDDGSGLQGIVAHVRFFKDGEELDGLSIDLPNDYSPSHCWHIYGINNKFDVHHEPTTVHDADGDVISEV